MLLFKKKFLESIRSGEKTQTIRFWDRCRMKPGQRSYIPGIGYISIDDVQAVELDRLTDADAVPDGFETAELLRHELRTIYTEEIAKGFLAYRIRFSVFPPKEQQRMKEEKRLKKERQIKQKQSDRKKKEFVESTLEKLHRMAASLENKK